MAAERRMQNLRSGLDLRDRADGLERLRGVFRHERIARRETREHVGQRTDLHRLAFETRSLDPAVFSFVLELGDLRLGLAFERMELARLVIRVRRVLHDTVAPERI